MFMKHPLALACAAIISQVSYAQSEANNSVAVEKQVVSATRSVQDISSLPYTVQLISQEDLQRQTQPGKDLGTILGQMIPGLSPGDNAVTSYYQSLRGRSVLVLIDGVAQRANRNISRQLTAISPDTVERIEVINGATSLYGAGATGGVINIITKKSQSDELKMRTTVGLTVNTEETDTDSHSYSLGQSISGRSENIDYLLSANYEQRGSFFDADGKQIATDPNQVSRDNSNTLDLLLNTGIKFDEDKKLSVSVEYFKDEMDTKYAADFGQPDPAYLGLPVGLLAAGGAYTPIPKEGLQLSQQPETERKSITLEFNDQDFFGQNLISQLNYREQESYFYPYPGVPLFVNVNWDNVLTQALATPPADTTAAFGIIAGNLDGASASLTQSLISTKVFDYKLALNSEFDLAGKNLNLTYGLDYIHDTGKQISIVNDYDQWAASGQTQYNATGDAYSAGPEATTQTAALFAQGQLQVTDDLSLSAGIRQEWIDVEVDDYLSAEDAINAAHYNAELDDASLALFAGALGMTSAQLLQLTTDTLAASFQFEDYIKYSDAAVTREGGSGQYNATLLNLGALYNLSETQETYANFSQGFTVPDMTRLLRSINIFSDNGNQGPILASTNVKPIKTNSVDIGWRMRGNFWETHASIYHNQSDRNIHFDSITGIVTIKDQKEEIQGLELSVNAELPSGFNTGASYAYTEGTTRDDNNKKVALGAERVTPQKLMSYVGFNKVDQFDVRLQVTHLADYSDANEDNPTQAVAFQGYTTADLLTSFSLPAGTISAGVQNLANEEYMPLYNQVRGYPAFGASAYLPAQGRTVSLSYSIDY